MSVMESIKGCLRGISLLGADDGASHKPLESDHLMDQYRIDPGGRNQSVAPHRQHIFPVRMKHASWQEESIAAGTTAGVGTLPAGTV